MCLFSICNCYKCYAMQIKMCFYFIFANYFLSICLHCCKIGREKTILETKLGLDEKRQD